MKTIQIKSGKKFEVSNEQFELLSMYATINNNTNSDKKYWQLWGLKTAGDFINIPWELFYDIEIENRISGYKNMNKLSVITYFE